MGAKEISSLLPQLKQHNVRLIGVGLEPIGVEEFIEGKFFDGELFLDDKKESYKKLGFKRIGILQLLPNILSMKAILAGIKAFWFNVGGNITVGDGYQNGGVLVVGAGGSPTMLTFVQQESADQVDNTSILEALGIKQTP